MKKALFILLVLCLSFSVFAQGAQEAQTATAATQYAIAMITDSGDITDQSFNQSTYEACRDYAAAHGVKFQYYKPTGDSDEAREASIEKAIDDGFNIVVMPGYLFGPAIAKVAPEYPDIKFVALDVSEYDVGGAISNVYCMLYQEEIAGYLAGYAAVALGYTNLGFCGGMAVPAVIRYGYGFVQGADAAAAKLGKTGTIQYTYANQFFGDADVTAAMDTMYANGAEVVFACGGGVYTSVAEAAAKVGKKLIGVDVDQKGTIDGAYGAGLTLTSAMKGLYASTQAALKTIIEDNAWNTVAGTFATLGLVSGTDMDANFVGIPTGDGTEWSSSFSLADYKALVNDVYTGKLVISNDTSVAPADNAKVLTVRDLGNIK